MLASILGVTAVLLLLLARGDCTRPCHTTAMLRVTQIASSIFNIFAFRGNEFNSLRYLASSPSTSIAPGSEALRTAAKTFSDARINAPLVGNTLAAPAPEHLVVAARYREDIQVHIS